MASTKDKKSNFHRLVDLNTTCASFVLRKYLEMLVNKSGFSLKDHLQQALKENKITFDVLTHDQRSALQKSDPVYEDFDVSILTLVILNTCDVSEALKLDVKALRTCRNKIAHIVSGEITGATDFNKASQSLLTIAKEVGSEFKVKVYQQINEIRSYELVHTYWNMEMVQLNGEALMMKLVSNKGDPSMRFIIY